MKSAHLRYRDLSIVTQSSNATLYAMGTPFRLFVMSMLVAVATMVASENAAEKAGIVTAELPVAYIESPACIAGVILRV
jgi:hypothetical protein